MIKSIKNFFSINTFLLAIGNLQYYLSNQNYFINVIIFTVRNYILLNFLDSNIKNKTKISNILPKEDYPYEFHFNLVAATIIETTTHIFIKNILIKSNNTNIIYIIPISFLFEIVFDLFHYTTHRMLHHEYIYKYIHKKHHKFNHPSSIITFYQDPIDLLITNSFPTISTMILLPFISYYEFTLISIYKSFIEIGGHSGIISKPTCSFPQFIWLPKIFNIELYTEHHDLHHSSNNCNYSKRFSLWDKIFGTFKDC